MKKIFYIILSSAFGGVLSLLPMEESKLADPYSSGVEAAQEAARSGGAAASAHHLIQVEPGSYFDRNKDMHDAYTKSAEECLARGQRGVLSELNKRVRMLGFRDFHSLGRIKKEIETFMVLAKNAEAATGRGVAPSGSMALTDGGEESRRLVEEFLSGLLKKLAPGRRAIATLGVLACLTMAGAAVVSLNATARRSFNKWWVRGGSWHYDRSGNQIQPYALSKVLSGEEKMAIASALKTHPILSKRASMSLRASLRSANTKSFMLAAGLKYREWAERRNAELRRFVVEPDPDGDVWQRTAYAIQQTEWLSVERFNRARQEAREHVVERLEELYVSPDPATIQYPEWLIREGDRFGAAFASELSRYSLYGNHLTFLKESAETGPKSLNTDGTFVYTFCPPGGGGVILKVPNPYAFYKMQDIYRMMGAMGENHSPRRNVDRVLVADAIRQYELEHPEAGITAPQKFLAFRPGADRRSITDATAIVMAQPLAFEVDPRIEKMTDAEIDRLLDISEIYGLIDLHDDNIKRDKRTQKLTIIDTERVQASWDTLAECYRQENLTNERFYPGVSDRIKARIRERKGMLAK